MVSEQSKPEKYDEKKEEDKDNQVGAVPAKQSEKVEIKIAPPTENRKEPALLPAKVEVKIESVSALGGKHTYTAALHAQLKDLEKAKYVEKLPTIVIKKAEDDDISVEVIVIVSFADSSDTLIHSGNFILQAVDSTTLMEIKKGISKALDIRYEDMSIACGRRFLSDCRSLYYYAIFDGVTIHLLVDTPDEIFKNVFKAFLNLGHDEAAASLATRGFIAEMNTKYQLDEGDNPVLTEDLLMFELGQFYVPEKYDSDLSDSDDSTDEDYSIDENEYPPSVFHIDELEMLLMQDDETFAPNHNINADLLITDLHDNFVNEDDGNSDNDNVYFHNEEENTGDNDSSYEEDSDVFHIDELEMLLMQDDETFAANHNIIANLLITDLHDNFVNEDDGNSDNDNVYLHNEQENTGDNDSSNEEDEDSDSDTDTDTDSDSVSDSDSDSDGL